MELLLCFVFNINWCVCACGAPSDDVPTRDSLATSTDCRTHWIHNFIRRDVNASLTCLRTWSGPFCIAARRTQLRLCAHSAAVDVIQRKQKSILFIYLERQFIERSTQSRNESVRACECERMSEWRIDEWLKIDNWKQLVLGASQRKSFIRHLSLFQHASRTCMLVWVRNFECGATTAFTKSPKEYIRNNQTLLMNNVMSTQLSKQRAIKSLFGCNQRPRKKNEKKTVTGNYSARYRYGVRNGWRIKF